MAKELAECARVRPKPFFGDLRVWLLRGEWERLTWARIVGEPRIR
jgi:hypothetical protein